MSNFDQYTFTKPKAQQPIKAKLSSDWDKTKKLMVTMPQMRRNVLRTLGIKGNPPEVTIPFSDDAQSGYQLILGLAQTNIEHVAKFEAQAKVARQNKQMRKLLSTIAELIGN